MGKTLSCVCPNNTMDDRDIATDSFKFQTIKSSYILGDRQKQNLFSKIYQKLSSSYVQVSTVTKEYFNDLIDRNPKAQIIIDSYPEIKRQISEALFHNNYMPPLRFINRMTGSIEYYEGEYNDNGEFNGIGAHLFDNYCLYIGQFLNDEYNGKGLMINNDGSSIYGDWINGECTGKGHLIIDGQLEYDGNFVNNQKNGMGVEKYPDGSMYEGNFANGEKNGHGKYTFPNGEYYEGDFVNDLYNGEGVYEWPSEGRMYKGQFRNGNIEGNGINTYKDGSQYNGYYVAGLKEGQGCYTWPNGNKFYGYWLNDVLHGNGKYISGNTQYNVVFRFGKIISSSSST